LAIVPEIKTGTDMGIGITRIMVPPTLAIEIWATQIMGSTHLRAMTINGQMLLWRSQLRTVGFPSTSKIQTGTVTPKSPKTPNSNSPAVPIGSLRKESTQTQPTKPKTTRNLPPIPSTNPPRPTTGVLTKNLIRKAQEKTKATKAKRSAGTVTPEIIVTVQTLLLAPRITIMMGQTPIQSTVAKATITTTQNKMPESKSMTPISTKIHGNVTKAHLLQTATTTDVGPTEKFKTLPKAGIMETAPSRVITLTNHMGVMAMTTITATHKITTMRTADIMKITKTEMMKITTADGNFFLGLLENYLGSSIMIAMIEMIGLLTVTTNMGVMVAATNGFLITMITVEIGTMTISPEASIIGRLGTVVILRIRTTTITRAVIRMTLTPGKIGGTTAGAAPTTQTGRTRINVTTTRVIMTASRASPITSTETSQTIDRPMVTPKTKTRITRTETTGGIFTTTSHKG
jgi:hypothetical protein